MVVVGDVEQLAQVRLRLLNDGVEVLGTVANLQHRRADARQAEQVALRLL
jgi:hypothetical protein